MKRRRAEESSGWLRRESRRLTEGEERAKETVEGGGGVGLREKDWWVRVREWEMEKG